MFRKGSRLLASGVLASVMLSGPQTAFASSDIDVSYRYWKPSISAKAGPAQFGGVNVDWLDAKTQLGITDQSLNDLRLSWRMNDSSKLQIASFSGSYSGTAAPKFSMNGYNLSAGTFKTDVDVKDLLVSWTKYTHESAGGDTRYGYMLGVKNVRIDDASNQVGGPLHFTKNFNITFPTVGLVIETGRRSPISGFAALSGAYAGSKGSFYDAEVGAKAFVDNKKTISASVGYRYLKIKAEKTNGDKLDISMSGPFFGIEKKF